jgi:hypothetical protein
MSPYERQIEDAVELDAVDVTYVLGVPGQATPSADETLEPLLNHPLSAQRLGTHDFGSEYGPTASELLAAAGIEVGPGLSTKSLGYDPGLGYDNTGSHYRRAERDTEVNALLNDSGNHSALALPPATGLDPKVGLGLGGTALALCLVPVLNVLAALLAVAALVVGVGALRRTHASRDENLRLTVVTLVLAGLAALGSVGSMAAYADHDGASGGQLERGNGAATAQVLAQDLGVDLGLYGVGGLPVTLTNTAHQPLSYNVTVEALDAAGRRVSADVAFVATLAPGQSTVATLFANADPITDGELAGAQFHVVEASAY